VLRLFCLRSFWYFRSIGASWKSRYDEAMKMTIEEALKFEAEHKPEKQETWTIKDALAFEVERARWERAK